MVAAQGGFNKLSVSREQLIRQTLNCVPFQVYRLQFGVEDQKFIEKLTNFWSIQWKNLKIKIFFDTEKNKPRIRKLAMLFLKLNT